jgi:hypothetical protein
MITGLQMKHPTRKLIRHDGTEIETGRLSLDDVHALIGADYLDTVNLRDQHGHVMLVDDLGHRKELPVNMKATALYLTVCVPETRHQIRGDVVIVPDGDFAL